MNSELPPNRRELFKTIVDESRQRLGRIARYYAGDEAEDLLQEILLQVWRSLPSFAAKSKSSTWCYRIALNTAVAWQRRKLREKRRPPPVASDPNVLKSPNDFANETQLLNRFLDSLSEIDRAVLLMYLEDLPNEEIAEAIGVSHGAIRTRLSRIRERLKRWEAIDG